MAVPGAPTSVTATANGSVADIAWQPPASDGGSPIFRYVVKVKGQATPVVQINDGDARTLAWGNGYTSATVFQVRAVNSVGFGAWAEATVDDAPPPPPPPPPPPTRPFLAYSAGAWVKQTITALGLHADTAKTSAMRAFINAEDPHDNPNLQGLTGGAGGGWGVSYALGTAADPVWKFSTSSSGPSQWASLETTGFHAPESLGDDLKNAKAQGGTDLPIEVIDTASGFTVWAGQVSYPGSDHVLFAGTVYGAFEHASNGLDRRATGADSTKNERSRGVIPDSMTIRRDQVQYGIDNGTDLGQRLEIFWWETDSAAGKISPPMAGFESGQSGWGAEGQVIGIDPAFVPAPGTPEAVKVIIRTGQNFGFAIMDNAGQGGTSLKCEQDHGQWTGLGMSQRSFDAAGLTWDDFIAYSG